MRISNEELENEKAALIYISEAIGPLSGRKQRLFEYITDLIESRERIKEMSQTLLTISQYPIASVCEDVRTLARNEWEKSKEYVE